MGQPAARMGDIAGHGGSIMFGATNVMIGGQPAARVGDPIVCPAVMVLIPHVGGNIFMGSLTVKIGGAFAARMGDPTGCMIIGISGAGMPFVKGPVSATNRSYDGPSDSCLGNFKTDGYSNAQGSQSTFSGTDIHERFGNDTNNFSLDAGNVQRTQYQGTGGEGGTGSGTMLQAQGNFSAGQTHTTITGTAGSAGWEYDSLNGTDGARTGIVRDAGGGFTILGIQGATDTGNMGPYDAVITYGAGAGVSPEGKYGFYYDARDGKTHIVGLISTMGWLTLGFDISVPGIGMPLFPGSIMMGCTTVLIGG